MSKSRGRHPRNRPARTRAPHARPPAATRAALPTLEAHEAALFREAARAELAGNARAASACLERIEQVRGSPHHEALMQLVEFEDLLPSWVRARWLVHQATRHVSAASEARHRVALDAAVRALEAEAAGGRRLSSDPAALLVRMTAHSWVYRQRLCFDLGGLSEVLDAASPELVAASGPVREWAGTQLGGYRLVRIGDGVASLLDLADESVIEILDVGSCAELDVGDHAVGRLVPIEGNPGRMPESRLLPADQVTAGVVAADPDDWLRYLVHEPVDRELRQLSDWDPGSLCSDIPELAWRTILLPEGVERDPAALDDALRRINSGPGTRVEDAVRLLRGLLGAWHVLPREGRSAGGYYAAAALLSPRAAAAAEEALGDPRWERPWRGLAAVVAEPARSVCRSLARTSAARASSAYG